MPLGGADSDGHLTAVSNNIIIIIIIIIITSFHSNIYNLFQNVVQTVNKFSDVSRSSRY